MTISLLIKINILRKNYYYYVTAILRMKVEKYVEGCCGEKVFYGLGFLSRNFNVDIKMDKKWMERFFASGEVQTKWRELFIHRANSQQDGVNLQRVARFPSKMERISQNPHILKKTLLTNSVNKASPQLLINMRRILRRR